MRTAGDSWRPIARPWHWGTSSGTKRCRLRCAHASRSSCSTASRVLPSAPPLSYGRRAGARGCSSPLPRATETLPTRSCRSSQTPQTGCDTTPAAPRAWCWWSPPAASPSSALPDTRSHGHHRCVPHSRSRMSASAYTTNSRVTAGAVRHLIDVGRRWHPPSAYRAPRRCPRMTKADAKPQLVVDGQEERALCALPKLVRQQVRSAGRVIRTRLCGRARATTASAGRRWEESVWMARCSSVASYSA